MELHAIGTVESSLQRREECPRQADESAPPAVLRIDAALAPALAGLDAGAELVVLTWLDRADRSTLRTRPRDNPARPELGVFATRSPDRPNPIGLHRTTVTSITGTEIHVSHLEALDGTPVIDIKPVLGDVETR